jgi:hypothetical protein
MKITLKSLSFVETMHALVTSLYGGVVDTHVFISFQEFWVLMSVKFNDCFSLTINQQSMCDSFEKVILVVSSESMTEAQ